MLISPRKNMCITEQTHESVHLHMRIAQEQDIILIMLTGFYLFIIINLLIILLIMLTAHITLTYCKMKGYNDLNM